MPVWIQQPNTIGASTFRRRRARITRTWVNELRFTTATDDVFNDPAISTVIDDLSATYSYPLAKLVSITARGGIGRWEESRSFGFPSGARSTGYSPAFGLNVDFGNKLVRAGLSIDLYPSVGDADYVRHYGVGCEPRAASAVISSRAGTGRVSVATQSRMSM